MAMAPEGTQTDRTAWFAIPAAAALLLWPALWNGFPIVFADTGTYLSQAIHLYAGWDRPVFYSLFMLPLHATVTLWPVIAVQALLASWVLWLVCRVCHVGISATAFVAGAALLAASTWLPWIVSELMPDVFTPLLVLVSCLLAWTPGRVSRWERMVLAALATFMIASQQSSIPLACVLLAVLGLAARFRDPPARAPDPVAPPPSPIMAAEAPPPTSSPSPPRDPSASIRPAAPTAPGFRRWPLLILPPALALLALCSVNLAAHGRFAVSPFGNIFLLARVLYDGPGMAVLHRDCPGAGWRLCPYRDDFPPLSDDFLWAADSPLVRAGGPKPVSEEAGAIIRAALIADPAGEARAAVSNTVEQLITFASGDGLNPWPDQVSHRIVRDFPSWEAAAYAHARQQAGQLSVPPILATLHLATALAGIAACIVLLPIAVIRRARCAGFLLAVLIAVPVSAAITGALSTPHDRYQSRIMWLPPFIAATAALSLRRPPARTPAQA